MTVCEKIISLRDCLPEQTQVIDDVVNDLRSKCNGDYRRNRRRKN